MVLYVTSIESYYVRSDFSIFGVSVVTFSDLFHPQRDQENGGLLKIPNRKRKYIYMDGEIWRSMDKIFKEHIFHLTYDRYNKSAFAEHSYLAQY